MSVTRRGERPRRKRTGPRPRDEGRGHSSFDLNLSSNVPGIWKKVFRAEHFWDYRQVLPTMCVANSDGRGCFKSVTSANVGSISLKGEVWNWWHEDLRPGEQIRVTAEHNDFAVQLSEMKRKYLQLFVFPYCEQHFPHGLLIMCLPATYSTAGCESPSMPLCAFRPHIKENHFKKKQSRHEVISMMWWAWFQRYLKRISGW